MSQRVESHFFPAIVGVIGVAAFLILVYLMLSFGINIFDRLFGGSDVGTPIVAALTQVLRS